MNVAIGSGVGMRVAWLCSAVGMQIGWVGVIVVPSTGAGVGRPGRFMPGQTVLYGLLLG